MKPGYDTEAEDNILSAMIQGNKMDEIMADVKAEDFSTVLRQQMFSTLADMHNSGAKVDVISAAPVLQSKPFWPDLTAYLSYSLWATMLLIPSQIPSYIKRLKDSSEVRKVINTSRDVLAMMQDGATAEEAYGKLETALLSRTSNGTERTLITPQDMAAGCFEAYWNRMDEATRKKRVLYTHFKKLNDSTGGFEKGDLIILSAESGAGKSAFSMNLARDIGVTQKRPVLYMNSEMSTEQQQIRWDSFLCGISHSRIRSGLHSEAEEERLQTYLESLHESKLYTLNIPDLQIANVLTEVRMMKAKYGIEMAIIDYIGRMDTMNQKDVKEWQVLLNAARMLKTLAQEQDITVIMVAQLTADGGRLAQGSYMKHEADLWVNIKRFSEDDLYKARPWNCCLEFRKARNTETGKKLLMNFYGDMLTFTDDQKEAQTFWEMEQAQERSGPSAFGTDVDQRQLAE